MGSNKPYYWLGEEQRLFLARGYLDKEQTAEQRIDVIAQRAEELCGIKGFGDKFQDYMSRGWFSLASPVWSNYGTNKGYPVSCFGSYLDDNMPSILNTHSEVGMLSKYGGGTSGYFGAIRPRGSDISGGGKTDGAVRFTELFDKLTNVVSQGSVRRGHFSPYLPIEHNDFDDFCDIGSDGHAIQNLNHGITVTDEFMNKVKDRDPEAMRRWAKVIQRRNDVGFPYIFFTDTVNREKPQAFKDAPIYASNMCVAPETRILTDEGHIEIATLEGKKINVWNGQEWSKVTVKKTGENQRLMRVTLSDGSSIDCTPEHKFYVMSDNYKTVKMVLAKDLEPSMKLEKSSSYPLDTNFEKNRTAKDTMYSEGFYSGDGNEGHTTSYVYEPKEMCIPKLVGDIEFEPSQKRYRWKHKEFVKYQVPTDPSDFLVWLAGYLDADGCILTTPTAQRIQAVSTNKEFLFEIKLMLQRLGVDSSVYLRRHEGCFALPANDGSGELKDFDCRELWLLSIGGIGSLRLVDLGFNSLCQRLDIDPTLKPNREAKGYTVVESIHKNTHRTSDTFCFTEPKQHKGVFNGQLTGQCSEICLPSDKDNTFVCVLSSMNLLHYDDWKDTDAVETLTIFLDTVCTEFIEKAQEMAKADPAAYTMIKRAVDFCAKYRALGLGVLGWHSLLQSKMLPIESRDAAKLNLEIFKLIRRKAEKASIDLHDWDNLDGKKWIPEGTQKNATLMAIAPTKSSSFILGNVSQGIEPELSNYFVDDLAKIKTVYKNPYLTTLLQEKGMDTEEVWASILQADGSVQHLDFLDDMEKGVFKTFAEINPETIIDQAAVRQKYIDQSQSLNLMIDPTTPTKDINALYFRAWEMGVKTLYYQYSLNAAQVKRRAGNVQEGCAACEG